MSKYILWTRPHGNSKTWLPTEFATTEDASRHIMREELLPSDYILTRRMVPQLVFEMAGIAQEDNEINVGPVSLIDLDMSTCRFENNTFTLSPVPQEEFSEQSVKER